MWPSPEYCGEGVLAVSLSYGIGGSMVTVAVLSLALNLVLTGLFIYVVKHLLCGVPQPIGGDARQTVQVLQPAQMP